MHRFYISPETYCQCKTTSHRAPCDRGKPLPDQYSLNLPSFCHRHHTLVLISFYAEVDHNIYMASRHYHLDALRTCTLPEAEHSVPWCTYRGRCHATGLCHAALQIRYWLYCSNPIQPHCASRSHNAHH